MNKILLTGGGTAGHVTPNLALVPYLKEAGFEIEYMGSYQGIEKNLVEAAGIPYHGISSGKLRRYLDIKNLTDPARILKGLHEARKYMKVQRPDVVFSKGGFVSVPVVMAASEQRIPVVIHESDLSPGLANKLSIPRASRVCYSFPETGRYLSQSKSIHTGLPVRRELINGSRSEGLNLCGFDEKKPVLMVIGGSLGSLIVNEAVRSALPLLLPVYQIIHVCGSGKMDESYSSIPGYRQFEYVNEELANLFAASDLIISRAGANVINELAALKKPAILIPLGTDASRGDQVLNAESFEKRGLCRVLLQENMTPDTLVEALEETWSQREQLQAALRAAPPADGTNRVLEMIEEVQQA